MAMTGRHWAPGVARRVRAGLRLLRILGLVAGGLAVLDGSAARAADVVVRSFSAGLGLNAVGMVDASEDTGMQYLFTLVGEYGRVVIDELNNRWTIQARTPQTRPLPFTRYGADTEPVLFDPSEDYDLVTLTRRAIDELAGEGPISCTCADGRRSLELVVAFHESDAMGHIPVALPLDGPALGREVRIA